MACFLCTSEPLWTVAHSLCRLFSSASHQHCATWLLYLWTGKLWNCIGHSVERRLPSSGRFSALLPAAENSTGTACHGTLLPSVQVSLPLKRILVTRLKLTLASSQDANMTDSENRLKSHMIWIELEIQVEIRTFTVFYLRACTRLRSVNSWSSTKAWRTWILKSSLSRRKKIYKLKFFFANELIHLTLLQNTECNENR